MMRMMLHSRIILILLLLPADVLGKHYNGRCSITSTASALNNYNTILSIQKRTTVRNKAVTLSPKRQHYARLQLALLLQQRGGGGDSSIQINDEEDEGEYENYDDEEEEDEEEVEEETVGPSSEVETKSIKESSTSIIYDAPWVINPINSFMVQIAVMMMCRKVDLNEYRIVRLARIIFIGYVVIINLFTLYVKLRAKRDIYSQTIITLDHPVLKFFPSHLLNNDNDHSNKNSNMMQSLLLSRFLPKTTLTHFEYDIQQANALLFGLLPNMIFMYILHFHFHQVQPLFLTVASGFFTLIYNPLFQIYIFGRRLQRPFQTSSLASNINSKLSAKIDETDDESIKADNDGIKQEISQVEEEEEEEEDGTDEEEEEVE